MDKEKILKYINSEVVKDTLMETLSITYTDVGEDFLEAKMPVNSRVYQPMGILHGGASLALAESVGSAASAFFIDKEKYIIKGLEISANHVRSVSDGIVTATARFIHKGRTTHLWEIRIVDQENNLISIAKLSNIILPKK